MSSNNVPSLAEYHPELVQEVNPEQQEQEQRARGSGGLVYGSVNVLGLRIPNLILLLVVLVLVYYLYKHYSVHIVHISDVHAGGALDLSATPGSASFLRNLNIN